jgi:hypothetical protein
MSNPYLRVNTFLSLVSDHSRCWEVKWLPVSRSKGCPNVYSMILSFSGIAKLPGATIILTLYELLII